MARANSTPSAENQSITSPSPSDAQDGPPVRRLVVLASLPGLRNSKGDWLLSVKFVNGMKMYAQNWPGPVVVGLQAGHEPTGDLDNRYWSPAELPFELQMIDFSELAKAGGELLPQSTVIVTINHLLYGLGQRCLEQGAILVANTELTLRTQLQIAQSVHGWGARFFKTSLWLLLNHRRAQLEIRTAKGLQCNGTPTYNAFARLNQSPLLYFDNRVTSELYATDADIEARFESLSRRQSLRLLFSGRLHTIKGVHHLVPLARLLRDRGMRFELWIAGDGPLRSSLEVQIAEHALQDQVRLLGTLDFYDGLIPLLRREIDLFVCPHLQGDPSCTYLETLSGGVPIVGYDNQAWRGVQQLSSAGRVCTLGEPAALASEIEALSNDHDELKLLAQRALAFSMKHEFEAEFERRVTHLLQLAASADHRS